MKTALALAGFALVLLLAGLYANHDVLEEAFTDIVWYYTPGRWDEPMPGTSLEERREMLVSLGYLQAYNPAPMASGVIYHNVSASYSGVNFFNSGHAPIAYLMDNEGAILHVWNHSLADQWPEKMDSHFSTYWRRAFLREDGSILAIHEGMGLLKLDVDSNLVWSHFGEEHHDLDVGEDGLIYALSHKKEHVPSVSDDPLLVDYVTILNATTGDLIKEFSLLKALLSSPYASLINESGTFYFKDAWDLLHANSIQVFDGSLAHLSPLYEEGNALISIREMDTILIVDLADERIIWARTEANNVSWHRQHEAVLLPSGSMLVFDNKGVENLSRVIEFDPLTGDVLWIFDGRPHHPINTGYFGTAQRLPNGNTLIADSENGRAVEVTPAKDLVWEYISPYRAGDDGELVAVLFAIERVDCNQTSWLTYDNCTLKVA